MLCDTIIRAQMGTDPLELSDDEWVVQLQLALWIEARAVAKQAEMIAKLLG